MPDSNRRPRDRAGIRTPSAFLRHRACSETFPARDWVTTQIRAQSRVFIGACGKPESGDLRQPNRIGALATIFERTWFTLRYMDTHLDQKPIRALRQRYPLLDAWLEAMDRLDGPRCRFVTVRHIGTQRRPLIQSIEQRHPVGRRRLPYLVVSR